MLRSTPWGTLYLSGLLLFWSYAMGWLAVTKILPSWHSRGEVSTRRDDGWADLGHPLQWTIYWSGREIGWSRTQTAPTPGHASSTPGKSPDNAASDGLTVHHQLELRRLSLAEISQELWGPMAPWLTASWVEPLPEVNLRLDTLIRLDGARLPRSFRTEVRIPSQPPLLALEGTIDAHRLTIVAFAPTDQDPAARREVLRQSIDFPPDTELRDLFAPPSRYVNLQPGDQWTTSVYRLFPPNAPLQRVHVQVAGEELIAWNGTWVRTKVVVFRPATETGPTVSQQPLSKMWVRDDGLVLQQEAQISRAHLRFVRQPTPSETLP